MDRNIKQRSRLFFIHTSHMATEMEPSASKGGRSIRGYIVKVGCNIPKPAGSRARKRRRYASQEKSRKRRGGISAAMRRSQARMRQNPFKGAGSEIQALDEQVVPALLLHHVPPVDALDLSSGCDGVVLSPYVFQKFADPAEGSEVCCIA